MRSLVLVFAYVKTKLRTRSEKAVIINTGVLDCNKSLWSEIKNSFDKDLNIYRQITTGYQLLRNTL